MWRVSDPLVPLLLTVLDEPWPAGLEDRVRWFAALGWTETAGSIDPGGMSYGMLDTSVPGVHGMWQGNGPDLASLDLICSYGDGVAKTRAEVLEALSERLGTPTRSTWFTPALKVWLSRVQDGAITVQLASRG